MLPKMLRIRKIRSKVTQVQWFTVQGFKVLSDKESSGLREI